MFLVDWQALAELTYRPRQCVCVCVCLCMFVCMHKDEQPINPQKWALRRDLSLDRFSSDPRSVLYLLLCGRELQVQGGKVISEQRLDQSSPQTRFLIWGINDRDSQMMIIDHSIDWLLSSIAPICLCWLLSVVLILSLTSFFVFLQKMTWKSRQADVDTCRMKGKHKVLKTHSQSL